jgi:MFS family permease
MTDHFHALDGVCWYAEAYLITSCATQLMWGLIFTFCNTKTVSLVAIVIFEAGFAIYGAAPSSTAFVIGRAIVGIGSAAIC